MTFLSLEIEAEKLPESEWLWLKGYLKEVFNVDINVPRPICLKMKIVISGWPVLLFAQFPIFKLQMCQIRVEQISLVVLVLLVGVICSEDNGPAANRSWVFDVFEYRGNDLQLSIKIRSMYEYVDYFIITEKATVNEEFMFHMLNFQKYSSKIIFLPVRLCVNPLGKSPKNNLKDHQFERDADEVLQLLAHPRDIIIFSRDYEIILRESLKEFEEKSREYSCTQMGILNADMQRAFLQTSLGKKPLYWYEGAKLFTYSFYKAKHNKKSFIDDLCSINNNPNLLQQDSTSQYLLPHSGWHFVDENFILSKVGDQSHDVQYIKFNRSETQLDQNFEELLRDSRKEFQEGKERWRSLKKTVNQPLFEGRKVIQCNPYNGEEHIFKLKLSVVSSYVDYYIITEGYYSHHGIYKPLTFNYSKFPEVAHKIIRLPIRNFPFIYNGKVRSRSERWNNQAVMRNSAFNVLKLLGMDKDIIIVDDADEMVTRAKLTEFNPDIDLWANCEQRLFYFYYNQRSTIEIAGKDVPNFFYRGTKITTFKYLKSLQGTLSDLRNAMICNTDVLSALVAENKKLFCSQKVIQLAGWHFSYILDKQSMQKKIRNTADFDDPYKKIENLTEYKKRAVAPGSKNKFIDIYSGEFPDVMVLDLLEKGQSSVYAPYFSDPIYYKADPSTKHVGEANNLDLLKKTKKYVIDAKQFAKFKDRSVISWFVVMASLFLGVIIYKIFSQIIKQRKQGTSKDLLYHAECETEGLMQSQSRET